MSEPTIWDIAMGGNPPEKFVPYGDYARLKAEVERLRKAGDALASSVQFREELDKDYEGDTLVHPAVKAWRDAQATR